MFCSARSLTATPSGRRRNAMYDEDDDLTKDMDDPTPEPNIQEASLPRVVNVKSHRDVDSQPIRGGTLLDIDEESEVRCVLRLFSEFNPPVIGIADFKEFLVTLCK